MSHGQRTGGQRGPTGEHKRPMTLSHDESSSIQLGLEEAGSPTSSILVLTRVAMGGTRAGLETYRLAILALECRGSGERETPAAERARLVDAFQDGGTPVFLISLRAGGTGLSLTAAAVVFHLDPWWTPWWRTRRPVELIGSAAHGP